jgi:hypothetical protein
MNRMQKIAVFNLVVVGITTLLMAGAVAILYYRLGWPKAARGLLFIFVAAIAAWVAPLIFKKDPGAVAFDERDKLICRTAKLSGFAASYLWFCLIGSIFAFLLEPALFKTLGLPIMIFGGALVVFAVHSITLLILYGRGGKNNE